MTTVMTDISDIELSYAEFLKVISETENLTERLFELTEDNILFSFDENDEDHPLKFTLNSEKFNLTAESALQAFQLAKIPKSILDVYDIDVILPLVNWYYANKDGEMKALVKGKNLVAFTRPGTEIYSIKEMVDEVKRALETFQITNFTFDNVDHGLKETNFSIILPDKTHELPNGDVLRAGIHVQHSVIGLKPLRISGYISRDFHENGMISVDVVEQWKRTKAKKSSDPTDGDADDLFDVYTWVFDTADTVVRSFNNEVKNIEFLTTASVGQHAGTLFNDIFNRYNLPAGIRKLVREEYVDQPGQQLYDLWNALTLTARRTELEDNMTSQKKLMETAGALASHPSSCKSCHRLTESA